MKITLHEILLKDLKNCRFKKKYMQYYKVIRIVGLILITLVHFKVLYRKLFIKNKIPGIGSFYFILF